MAARRRRATPSSSQSSLSSLVSSSSTDIEDVPRALASSHGASRHALSDAEVAAVRGALLDWYDANKRSIPWRTLAADSSVDVAQRAYAVWVSEIMCQQTQVATVVPYYERWMARWPTVQALAAADPESVNEAWAGLGYYSRARRLLEGARIVVERFGGLLPSDPAELQREVPGIGPYTAGAIASIAFGRAAGVVDGNVVRVLTRLRAFGGDPRGKDAVRLLWSLAERLVDPARPGDFNQAMMELGALVCTPTSPACATCPLSAHCHAYAESQGARAPPPADKADACALCDDADSADGTSVQRFPRKAARKESPTERYTMCVVARPSAAAASEREFLVVQRPPTGLLAGLWEFPTAATAAVDGAPLSARRGDVARLLVDVRGALARDVVDAAVYREHGTVEHVFSHVRHVYAVDSLECRAGEAISAAAAVRADVRWVDEAALDGLAASAALKKALQVWRGGDRTEKRRAKKAVPKSDPKQRRMDAFLAGK